MKKFIKNNLTAYTITASDNITQAVFIPEKGAVCASIIMPTKDNKKEILFAHDHLWNKNSKEFPGAWPICFPICARIGLNEKENFYRYENKIYEMHIHGFAYQTVWELADIKEDEITMKLNSTAETLQQYPFEFEAALTYKIKPGKLWCRFVCKNLGEKLMPYSFGFHPYFLTPPVHHGKDGVILNFRAIKHYTYNESMTDIIGEAALLKMPSRITNPDIREQLSLLSNDKKITLQFSDDDLTMTGDENFHYAQIYHDWNEPFICVEPWTAYPNAINHIEKPAVDNMPGMQLLKPNEEKMCELVLEVFDKED